MFKFTTQCLATPAFLAEQSAMRILPVGLLMAALVSLLYSPAASASGGVGLSQPQFPGGAGQVRQVDEIYESGKQIYKGRAEGAEKISYCVKVDGELKKLKRSSVKSFKHGSHKDFALALLDCDNPDRLALSTMNREQIPIVVYYLNKRFKLNLEDA